MSFSEHLSDLRNRQLTIRVNCENARDSSRKLCIAADSCAQMERAMQSAENELASYWRGEASDAFLEAMQRWIHETKAIEGELLSLSQSVGRIAQEFEAAENRIIAQIQAMGESFGSGGGTFGGGSGGSRF